MSNNTKMEKVTHELKQLRKLAALLQSVWHYGEFKSETPNEREMEAIMKEQGLWPVIMSAETFEPNLSWKGEVLMGGKIMMMDYNNPGNTSTTLDLIDEHMVIRETVGYDFLNKVPIENIPEVMEFLKIVFNYTKMNNIK